MLCFFYVFTRLFRLKTLKHVLTYVKKVKYKCLADNRQSKLLAKLVKFFFYFTKFTIPLSLFRYSPQYSSENFLHTVLHSSPVYKDQLISSLQKKQSSTNSASLARCNTVQASTHRIGLKIVGQIKNKLRLHC